LNRLVEPESGYEWLRPKFTYESYWRER